MKKITKEALKLAAQNCMFKMSEEEYDAYLSDISSVEKNLALLEAVEVPEDTEPMVFPYEIFGELLENTDDLRSSNPDELFSNSSNYSNGEIKIKRIIK